MAKQPSHLEIFFLRSVRVRKEHIAGQSDEGDGELMVIVERGQTCNVLREVATDLIIAETALDAKKSDNKDAIAEVKRLVPEEQLTETNRIEAKGTAKKKKAA